MAACGSAAVQHRQPNRTRLNVLTLRCHPVGPGPHLPTSRFHGAERTQAAQGALRCCAMLLPPRGHRVHRTSSEPEQAEVGLRSGWRPKERQAHGPAEQKYNPEQAQLRPRPSKNLPLQTKYGSARSASGSGRRVGHPMMDAVSIRPPNSELERGRHRHAAPAVAQRAWRTSWAKPQRLRRCEVPSGLKGQVLPDVRRERDTGLAGANPLASRGGRPRCSRASMHAKQDMNESAGGTHTRDAGSLLHGDAASPVRACGRDAEHGELERASPTAATVHMRGQ
ncbi:hypothetical protein FQA39_LY19090 [Lamprigera yunnana]|nr:hypothetical protein FQA39_LY19090 [Lamprigera yunnana]